MTTINELRDLTFYIIRKLNDLIINLTTLEPPTPRREIPNQFPNLTIDERIERIKRNMNIEETATPTPTIRDEQIEETQNRLDAQTLRDELFDEQEDLIARQERLIKEKEKFVKNLEKRINIERIKINNTLRTLSKVKELNIDNNTIKELEEEYEILNKKD